MATIKKLDYAELDKLIVKTCNSAQNMMSYSERAYEALVAMAKVWKGPAMNAILKIWNDFVPKYNAYLKFLCYDLVGNMMNIGIKWANEIGNRGYAPNLMNGKWSCRLYTVKTIPLTGNVLVYSDSATGEQAKFNSAMNSFISEDNIIVNSFNAVSSNFPELNTMVANVNKEAKDMDTWTSTFVNKIASEIKIAKSQIEKNANTNVVSNLNWNSGDGKIGNTVK